MKETSLFKSIMNDNCLKKFNINNKIINVFCNTNELNELPVIILNTFDDEGNIIWEKCREIGVKEFILVSIGNINWNNDLTPWASSSLYKGGTEYLGYADNYLVEIENDIIPKIEEYILNTLNKKISYYAIIGYSLGGLFALYAGFKTNRFKRIASISGSLWYPNFNNYVINNKLSNNIDKIYFSLGNKENKSKNEILSKVKDKTMEIYEYVSKSINSVYEENEGNHFKDEVLRTVKGIKWILE